MSTTNEHDVEVAVIGAGVVGCAVALAAARRGAAVALLEAEAEPGLAASGTNSGILHTGFDSPAGELETDLILRSQKLRGPLLAALDVPVLRCGAVMSPRDDSERRAVEALAENAARNRAPVSLDDDGALSVPGEAVTDPVQFTLALASAAERHGAELRVGWRATAVRPERDGLVVSDQHGESVRSRAVVNCAGLEADAVARLAGDDSFEIYPRKGEFLIFDPPGGEPLDRILLPVPTKRTKGVLVFPTVDGKLAAGPTAIDQEDKHDWSVRPEAREEILAKATVMYPPLADAQPIAAYAGLRPAGRGVNYVITRSRACSRLINVAAIRSTGLTASLGIAERVMEIIGSLGLASGTPRELQRGPRPQTPGPWWRRTAGYRAPV